MPGGERKCRKKERRLGQWALGHNRAKRTAAPRARLDSRDAEKGRDGSEGSEGSEGTDGEKAKTSDGAFAYMKEAGAAAAR